jgi:hypothetical protein
VSAQCKLVQSLARESSLLDWLHQVSLKAGLCVGLRLAAFARPSIYLLPVPTHLSILALPQKPPNAPHPLSSLSIHLAQQLSDDLLRLFNCISISNDTSIDREHPELPTLLSHPDRRYSVPSEGTSLSAFTSRQSSTRTQIRFKLLQR